MRRHAVSCDRCVSRHSNNNLTLESLQRRLFTDLSRSAAHAHAAPSAAAFCCCAARAPRAAARRTAPHARLSLLSVSPAEPSPPARRTREVHAPTATATRKSRARRPLTGGTRDASVSTPAPRRPDRPQSPCTASAPRLITSLTLFPALALHTQRRPMHASHSNARRVTFRRARTAAQM